MTALTTPSSRVFVGQLPPEFSEDELIKKFSPHGVVTYINNTTKGYAFVQFETEEGARSCVLKENNTQFLGKKINVNFAKDKKLEAENRNRDLGPGRGLPDLGPGRDLGPGGRDIGYGGRDGGHGGRGRDDYGDQNDRDR